MYELYQEQVLKASKEELWEFISRPENLNKITPPELDFTIVSEVPEEMYEGLIIQYKVKLPIIGTQDWITEIKHIEPGKQFVDEQRIGPYSFWYHYHALEETENGVKMTDRVSYQPPFGILGKMVNSLLIRNKLDSIFGYRKRIMVERFNSIV